MAAIIQGTTPTIQYTFNYVSVSDLTSVAFTIKMNGEIVLEKTLADAEVGTKTLSWTLSQQESLDLDRKTVTIMCNWLTAQGLRGASEEQIVYMKANHKNEVMT